MEPLQHDPRTKQQIKDLYYEFLYTPVQKYYEKRLNAIVIENTLRTRSGHKSFYYKGVFYNRDITPPSTLKRNRLVTELHPKMDEYLTEVKYINEQEQPFVLGFITQVLNSSNGLHDYLRILPEVLHPVLNKLVETCPCKACILSEEKAEEIRQFNQKSIQMVKVRMLKNLLL